MTAPELIALCHAVRRGDAVADDELVRFLHLRMGGYCFRHFGQNAEDALQRVALIVIDDLRLDRVEHPERVVYYAFTIARRMRFRELRRRVLDDNVVSIDDSGLARGLARFLAVPAAQEAQLLDREADELQARAFLRAFRGLDLIDQRIIRRFYFQNQDQVAIEQALDLTPNQFRLRKSRAIAKMRKAVLIAPRILKPRIVPKPGGEFAWAA